MASNQKVTNSAKEVKPIVEDVKVKSTNSKVELAQKVTARRKKAPK